MLSARGANLVVLAAIAVPAVGEWTGSEDPLSAGTEIVAVALMSLVVRATVHAIERADSRRRQHAERLVAVNRSMDRFTADAAHELRRPLAVAQSEIDVALDRERTPEEYRRRLAAVGEELGHMRRLIDALLTLARADAGALGARLEDVDLADLLEVVAGRWRSRAATQEVHFSTGIPDAATLVCDPDLLERVLDNLLENAFRHVGRGGEVSLSAGRDGDAWLLCVRDTGPGIDGRLRPVIFDRFTRDAVGGREANAGAGLGLAVCAAIVAAHGGTITLDPSQGRGAAFSVRIPARGEATTRRHAADPEQGAAFRLRSAGRP